MDQAPHLDPPPAKPAHHRPTAVFGIVLGLLSAIGGAVTAREAARLFGRVEGLGAILAARSGFAALSALFAVIFIASCVALFARASWAPRVVQTLCLVGIPIELIYQGIDSLFFVIQVDPNSNMKVLVLVQAVIFLGWGAIKSAYYFISHRRLKRARAHA